MKNLLAVAILAATAGLNQAQAHEVQAPLPTVPMAQSESLTLFKNVRIFNGTSAALSGPSHVLIRGNLIERISDAPIDTASLPGVQVIEGNGRTLMPGLIDAHWHAMFVGVPFNVAMQADPTYLGMIAGVEASRALMRGFTTVRDMGGASFGLKRAVDEGIIEGPRIYPSGAMITVTSGHGDFREMHDLPRQLGAPGSWQDIVGNSAIADSPDEVRIRTREQLMHGATQIKLTAGGGVSSPNSPLDAITFTSDELRAAVEAAQNWGTYVAVHAYTPEAIRRSIEAGVKVIEHGSLMDEDSAQLIASKDIWLSTQAFPDELANAFPRDSVQWAKAQEVFSGTDKTYRLAKKHNIKTAFGTDILFSSAIASQQGAILASLTRWYSPAQTLIMATGTNGELLQLSGKRNPYPGTIGVVREGALADLLLVNGDPITDISLIAKPEQSFAVIMKDGKMYKQEP